MTPAQREELKQAALAASPSPWKGDRYDGTVKYQLLDANENTVIKGDNGNSGDGGYGILNYEDEVYLKAANPAAILSLIAQVEALTVPQWISVEDRLPSDCEVVAIYDADNESFPVRTAQWLAGSCTFESEFGWLAKDEISHWMPLPAAPTIPAIPGTKEGA